MVEKIKKKRKKGGGTFKRCDQVGGDWVICKGLMLVLKSGLGLPRVD
jgi:hypothetical protein